MSEQLTPKYFIFKRLHSLAGLWLVVYLILHLLTNSQAALLIGNDGHGFIKSVNDIHNLPYLPVIEIAVLAVPILIHAIWGFMYLSTGKNNSYGTGNGNVPYLPEYSRNHAYTWQRITSWILVFGILAHVIHMRFFEYPVSAKIGNEHVYMVRVDRDDGLVTLSERLGVQIYDRERIERQREGLEQTKAHLSPATSTFDHVLSSLMDIFRKSQRESKPPVLLQQQKMQEEQFIEALDKKPLKDTQVIAVAPDFGTAELLMLRETFKMPIMLVLYTILVITACYHAFNGLWTAMISWGVTLTQRSQAIMRHICTALMAAVTFLGLAAIWLTYWVNLKQ